MSLLYDILAEFHIGTTPRAILVVIIGYFVARLIREALNKAIKNRVSLHQAVLLCRVAFYLILMLFIASAIQELGFHITALLGATGILTIAIGIASQTSLSNIISGVFIIGEKPFQISDTIKVNDIQGEVLSIDLLSVRIRTSDNTMVRIPNEALTKSAITNFSYFPIRRIDLTIAIAYKENLDDIRCVLHEVADKNSFCLDEPSAAVYIKNLGDSAINIQFSVWTSTKHYTELKSSIQEEIKVALAKKGINMPLPSQALYIGSGNEALPIKIIT